MKTDYNCIFDLVFLIFEKNSYFNNIAKERNLRWLDNLLDKSPMPTKKEVDKRVRIGELIYVKDYTREDGTKVSGYYRAYPKK